MDTQGAFPREFVVRYEHIQAARYHIVAPVAVLYFDWLLTFSLEIDKFWKFRLTGPTVLFLINRYFPIICFIPTMIAYFSDTFSPEVCVNHVIPFVVATNVISQSNVAAILALRTYALYHQDHTILLLVSLAWVAGTVIGSWGASCITHLELPPGVPGCLVQVPNHKRYQLAAAYGGSLAYDALIYVLTLWRSRSLRKARMRVKTPGNTLLWLVFRDGSIYFVVLLCTNLLNILLICFATPDLRAVNVTFTHIIPVTITSRLLLNLRREFRTSRTNVDPDTTNSSGGSDFLSAVLGNIGEDFVDDSLSRRGESIKPWEVSYDSGNGKEEIALQSIDGLHLGSAEANSWDDTESRRSDGQ